jgi:high affinity Mn2+ porin
MRWNADVRLAPGHLRRNPRGLALVLALLGAQAMQAHASDRDPRATEPPPDAGTSAPRPFSPLGRERVLGLSPLAGPRGTRLPPVSLGRTGGDSSGLYFGGSFGYGLGTARGTLSDPSPVSRHDSFGSLLSGVLVGYNRLLPGRFLVGGEGDISFPYFVTDGAVGSHPAAGGTVTEKIDFASTLRARVGYAFDRWLIYGTGGFAWSQAQFLDASVSGLVNVTSRLRVGWTAGAGVEVAIAPDWSIRLEYQFDHLGPATGTVAPGVRDQSTAIDLHELRGGFAWHPGWLGGTLPEPSISEPRVPGERWWSIHGQFTWVEQGYPSFHSPYEGANSLPGSGGIAHTATATAFLGVRLWQGAEVFFNPELDQGSGLGNTLGIAGFPNGEAQKASYPVPRFNYDRLFIRQTIDLGGEQERVEDGPNQIAGAHDVSRLTLTIGKLSVGDVFDVNLYADDPRTQFLNWNIFGGGSFDWTMDRPGWTWGAIVELNQRDWALRAGYFLVPVTSNADAFDLHIPTRGEYAVELEVPWARETQPGKLRLFGWVNRATMGSYSAALALPESTPEYPDITRTREVRTNYGFVANIEQAVTDDLGVFSRVSWSPGLLEIIGWTDCDWSLSLGGALNGARWQRPSDRLGVAGVIEGLSPEAQAYFAAGGLGILIGDGRLNYRPEGILETYYACNVLAWLTLSADYQFVASPGYNADRGPVSVFSGRIHLEF